MIKSYLKILFRSSTKHAGFTFINILGLTLGIATCIIIVLFVKEERSYDTFHNDYKKIFRVYHKRTYPDKISYGVPLPVPLAPEINNKYAEVESLLEIRPSGNRLFKMEDHLIFEPNGLYTSSEFFEFFNIKVISGDPTKTLELPNNLILTEKLARKYYGDNWQDMVGKNILIDNSTNYTVSGIIENPSSNFHLSFDYLISKPSLGKILSERDKNNWLSPRHYVYLKLNDEKDKATVENYLSRLAEEIVDPKTSHLGYSYKYFLQPLERIHLYSTDLKFDIADKGNADYVNVLSAIAGFILFLACANFINISTARANQRAKEVGLRKVSGASRTQIIFQFLGESFFMVLVAMILGSFLVEVTLPFFNTLIAKELSFNLLNDFQLIAILTGLLIITSVLAGGYVAFYISSIQPSRVLKDFQGAGGFNRLRKVLVSFQFGISIMLIMGSLILFRQLDYLQNKNLGFNKEEVVVVPIINSLHSKIHTIKNELLKKPEITSITASYGLPGSFIQGESFLTENKSTLSAKMYLVDDEFIATLGMQMVSGRDFNGSISDRNYGFIVNETAAKMMGYTPQSVIGKQLGWGVWLAGDTVKRGPIIGVTKDFNYGSLQAKIDPVVIHQFSPRVSHLAIKVNGENIPETLEYIKNIYADFQPNRPFGYSFLDEYFDSYYKSEETLAGLLQIFTFLTIIIACLGLLGLAAYSTVQRKKEICIRKIHGASVRHILSLLHSDLYKLAFVSSLVAIPVAYLVASDWLNNYAYHIEVGWQSVTTTLLIIFAFSTLTVSYFSIKAAGANPSTVLRNES